MKADAEKAALEFATEFFRRFRDRLDPEVKDKFFIVAQYEELKRQNPEAARHFLFSLLMTALHEADEAIVDAAKEIAIKALHEPEPLPYMLKFFIEACVRHPGMRVQLFKMPDGSIEAAPEKPGRARGVKRDTNLTRDAAINRLIYEIKEIWGFNATRSTPNGRASAASIVAAALKDKDGANIHLEEKSVNKIWENRDF